MPAASVARTVTERSSYADTSWRREPSIVTETSRWWLPTIESAEVTTCGSPNPKEKERIGAFLGAASRRPPEPF